MRPTSLCPEHLYSMFVGLELEICIMEACGSEEWQIGLYEE